MSNISDYSSSILTANTLNSFWNDTEESSSDLWWSNSSSGASSYWSDTSSSTTSTYSTSGYGIDAITNLAEAAEAAYNGLGLGPNDRVTFATIEEYKTKISEEFASAVEEGLKEVGISDDVVYQIVTSYSGEGVEIITASDEDKAKIAQFFNENPELVAKFEEIQFLDNVSLVQKNESIDEHLAMSRIQLQAMSSMYLSNPSSSIMSYGDGNSYFGTGFSTIV